jgi:hypothetical protein
MTTAAEISLKLLLEPENIETFAGQIKLIESNNFISINKCLGKVSYIKQFKFDQNEIKNEIIKIIESYIPKTGKETYVLDIIEDSEDHEYDCYLLYISFLHKDIVKVLTKLNVDFGYVFEEKSKDLFFEDHAKLINRIVYAYCQKNHYDEQLYRNLVHSVAFAYFNQNGKRIIDEKQRIILVCDIIEKLCVHVA